MKGSNRPPPQGWRGRLVALAMGVAACAACSSAFAQSPSGSAPQSSQGAVPQSPAAGAARTPQPQSTPRPGDLEPGVNTSAIQPSAESSGTPGSERTPSAAPATGSSKASRSGKADTSSKPETSTKPETSGKPETSATAAAPGAAGPEASVSGRTNTAPKTGAAAGKAHDSIQLDTTQITGNRELPKVLYIVPWKRSDLGDLVGKPVNSLLDEVLAPVDRDVFKRQNRYYDALKPDSAKDAAGSATQGPDVKH